MKKLYLLLFFVGSIHVAFSQTILFSDPDVKSRLLLSSPTQPIARNQAGTGIIVDTNANGEIEVSEALQVYQVTFYTTLVNSLGGFEYFTNIEKLTVYGCNIPVLDASVMPNLEELICYNAQMTSLNVSNLVHLEKLICSGNQLTTIGLDGCTSLKELDCFNNQLTSLNISGFTQLTDLSCYNNQIPSLDLTGMSSLVYLTVYGNQLTSLDLTDCSSLKFIECQNNFLTSLDVTPCAALLTLQCQFNQLGQISFGNPLLGTIRCNNNVLTGLDLSGCPELSQLYAGNNQLTYINSKNGSYEITVQFNNNPQIAYICVDEINASGFQVLANNYGYTNCVINSYCSFVPGGDHFVMSGQSTFDSGNDGCDVSDIEMPNLKFELTGATTGTYLAFGTGNYLLTCLEGSTVMTPVLENPSYFNVSPGNVTANFPSEASPVIQNFCITPAGNFPDLEIVILPLEPGRSGTECDYKIIYKNNGTTTQSGVVNLLFDDAHTNFITSSETPSTTATGNLSWNYSNLSPLETREITFTMYLNNATQNPPLSIGDQLDYGASINPMADDVTPLNNVMGFKQVVVNSFDPNDKTCLEGSVVSPEVVGQYVHYMIRFENTGNADALNIVVKDIVDTAKFDVTSLIPIDSSHDFTTRITSTNKVEFIFENINLPFDDASNDGYVAFKIKTKPTLVVGDTFSNSASIYFDYNYPIVTNIATTTIQLLDTPEFELSDQFIVYPNPASGLLRIDSQHGSQIISVEVFNALGQLVSVFTGGDYPLDISSLETGTYFAKVRSDKGAGVVKFVRN